jgi:hypothetical protein
MVGHELAIVGHELAMVGHGLAMVGHGLAMVGDRLAMVAGKSSKKTGDWSVSFQNLCAFAPLRLCVECLLRGSPFRVLCVFRGSSHPPFCGNAIRQLKRREGAVSMAQP